MVDASHLSLFQEKFRLIKQEMKKVIMGQDDVIEQILIAFFIGGHVLIEGVPGLGKTLLAKSMSYVVGGRFKRIQFTPDLMPSDIIGTTIYNVENKSFQVKKGPIFTDLLLADEINRAPAKTQSALLEAMQERAVTIDGVSHSLGDFFMCLATQNPIELEGTYPLPEAQVDRFLMKVLISYPSQADENEILKKYREGYLLENLSGINLLKILDSEQLLSLRSMMTQLKVDDKILDYITNIICKTRQSPGIELGSSPRGSVALLQVAKVNALLSARDFLIPEDVKKQALAVLRHRIILEPEAEIEGLSADAYLNQIINDIPVPR